MCSEWQLLTHASDPVHASTVQLRMPVLKPVASPAASSNVFDCSLPLGVWYVLLLLLRVWTIYYGSTRHKIIRIYALQNCKLTQELETAFGP